jgi:hypothetical protein
LKLACCKFSKTEVEHSISENSIIVIYLGYHYERNGNHHVC